MKAIPNTQIIDNMKNHYLYLKFKKITSGNLENVETIKTIDDKLALLKRSNQIREDRARELESIELSEIVEHNENYDEDSYIQPMNMLSITEADEVDVSNLDY